MIVALVLYMYDYLYIKRCEKSFTQSVAKKQLFAHMLQCQLFEMRMFLPFGIAFNLVAFLCIWLSPTSALFFIFIPNIFAIIALIPFFKTYSQRTKLILKS